MTLLGNHGIAERPTRRSRDGGWQVVAAVLLAVLCVLGALGVTQRLVFSEPSLLKAALTTLGPLFLLFLLDDRVNARVVIACAIAFVAPFAFTAETAGVSITLVDLLVVLGVVRVAVVGRSAAAGRPAIAVGYVIFVGCLLPAAFLGDFPGRVVHILVVAPLVTLLCADACGGAAGRRPLVGAFVGSAVLQALLAIYEFATETRLNLYTGANAAYATDYFFSYDGVFRSSAALPDPIALGNVLAMACPLCVLAALTARTVLGRGLAMLAGVIVVIGLATTLSRLSWIAAVAGAVIACLLAPSRSRYRALAAVGLIGALAVTAAVAFGGPALLERFGSIADPTDARVTTASGDIARLRLQHAALELGNAHPYFGVGLGQLPEHLLGKVPGASLASHAHSTYYNLYAEAGVVGLIGLAALLVAFGTDLLALRRQSKVVFAGVVGSVVALLLCWLTDYTVRNFSVAAVVAVVFAIGVPLSRGDVRAS